MIGSPVKTAFPCVTGLVDDSIRYWNCASTDFPALGRRYSYAEQREREKLLDNYLDRLEKHLRQASRARVDAEKILENAIPLVVDLSICALDLDQPYVKCLLRDGFSKIGIDLAVHARRLDPAVTIADILQACRNAWTACALQLMLAQPLEATPAIFAYSMLYPYSDNYLDDPQISSRAKVEFSERFRQRLAGDWFSPVPASEATIWELVSIIESQYPRATYPQVYDSLLAIHAAQQASILQMKRGRPQQDFDALRLTFTKGGTSVLADAYLAAGTLTGDESKSAFLWGVLLQLGDDLQDFHDDRTRGSQTLFTQAAERGPLDHITNRVLHFGQHVSRDMQAVSKSPGILDGTPVEKRPIASYSQRRVCRGAVHG